MIDWAAFFIVLAASLAGASLVVTLYSLGLRLLSVSGRTPVIAPAEFTDQIAVITPAQLKSAEKRAAKAARKSPLTASQKRWAFAGSCGCFALSAAAVLSGIWLIVGEHVLRLLG